MYGTNPFYNPSFYGQDYRATNPMQQPAINQTFQLSPTQTNSTIRYAKDLDEVKRSLVFGDTFFIDKDYTHLWHRNASGVIKSYSLEEIIEQDDKDKRIAELEAKLASLEKEMKSNEPTAISSNNIPTTTNT